MASQIQQKYRTLAQLVKRLDQKSQEKGWRELRSSFRKPLASGESLDDRLKVADEKESFLRIMTPKERPLNQSGRWIYKDGEKVQAGDAKTKIVNGRVVSNWGGKNLDPDSVRLHNKQLKRAGFLSNAHAKGFF
jgi:hypothetical protein